MQTDQLILVPVLKLHQQHRAQLHPALLLQLFYLKILISFNNREY